VKTAFPDVFAAKTGQNGDFFEKNREIGAEIAVFT
jgi:hypothetical protein